MCEQLYVCVHVCVSVYIISLKGQSGEQGVCMYAVHVFLSRQKEGRRSIYV